MLIKKYGTQHEILFIEKFLFTTNNKKNIFIKCGVTAEKMKYDL